MINSRNKGKVGERQLRDQFREAGFLKARRGQQFSGEQGNPDVIVPELPSFHFEVKYTERANMYDWMAQAEHDSNGGGIVPTLMPVVCHRRKHAQWLAILRLADFLTIIKETDRVKL